MTVPASRFATLPEWLSWQESLHHSKIDLSLGRVAEVARRVAGLPVSYAAISVAGTNGKGSVCAYLNAILSTAGFKTGMFTSPHLLRYNERVQIDGVPVSDDCLLDAFARIDAARAETTLTYFEFSALAALLIFGDSKVDCAILEVGMGGRLDAVNIVDADVALISSIGLDHQQWLGKNREQIAYEKAGIMRSGKPAFCADRNPPSSLVAHAQSTGVPLGLIGRDFDGRRQHGCWAYSGGSQCLPDLPLPGLPGDVQIDNAALAIAGLRALGDRLPLAVGHISKALGAVRLPGRIQVAGHRPLRVFDVCHNPESAKVLCEWLAATLCEGRTRLVLGMLEDKDVEGVAAAMSAVADNWYLSSLPGDRGLSAEALRSRVAGSVDDEKVTMYASVRAAIEAAISQAREDDRVVVCGSFQTVGAAMALEL